MRIVLLSTGRGLRPAAIDEVLARLNLNDSDEVCVVSWYPPRNPLPVDHHLVLGPHLRVGRNLASVQRVQQRLDLTPKSAEKLPPSTSIDAASPTETGIWTDAPSPTETAIATDAPSPTETASPFPSANTTAHLPVFHPRRMRKAVTWRVRRLKRAWRVRRLEWASRVRRLKRAAARVQSAWGLTRVRQYPKLTRVRQHPKFRNIRNRMSLGVSVGFAAGCLSAGKVYDMTRGADLVVALDTASHRGAWALAQKVPGPDVVIGIAAATRLVEQREVSAPS